MLELLHKLPRERQIDLSHSVPFTQEEQEILQSNHYVLFDLPTTSLYEQFRNRSFTRGNIPKFYGFTLINEEVPACHVAIPAQKFTQPIKHTMLGRSMDEVRERTGLIRVSSNIAANFGKIAHITSVVDIIRSRIDSGEASLDEKMLATSLFTNMLGDGIITDDKKGLYVAHMSVREGSHFRKIVNVQWRSQWASGGIVPMVYKIAR